MFNLGTYAGQAISGARSAVADGRWHAVLIFPRNKNYALALCSSSCPYIHTARHALWCDVKLYDL